MKKLLLTLCCASIFSLLFARGNGDEQAIKNQVQAFLNSWNRHNYDDMNNYTTDSVEWVNIVGMWWKGRKEVQFAHQAYHNTMFKNTPLELKQATVRFVTADVAIVHMICYYPEFTTPDGRKAGNTDDIATIVFVKKRGKWLMEAGENVSINEAAKPHDPVKQMPKNE